MSVFLVEFERRLRVVPPTRGVVAVSGGADSVALLRGLVQLREPQSLIVAHLNHQLRGAESDADVDFVRELACSLHCTFATTQINIAHLAVAERANLEGTARRVRYEWLQQVAQEHDAVWIATGHTADDQAETVLHRLIRGTGLQGLRGIAAIRSDCTVPIVRPMLTITRAMILDYLNELQQPYREDSTNADDRFTRNRIRHELLPLLRTFNPAIATVLGRLADQAEDMFLELEEESMLLVKKVELPRAGNLLIFDAIQLTAEPDARIREMFRFVWQREKWPMNAMTFSHWERIVGIVREKHPEADFPTGLHLRRVGKVIQLGLR